MISPFPSKDVYVASDLVDVYLLEKIFCVKDNHLQISPEDIRWDGEDPGIHRRIGNSGQGRGVKKFFSRGGDSLGAGRGRGPKQLRKEFLPRQNGVGKRVLDDIELLNTESLVKEVGF